MPTIMVKVAGAYRRRQRQWVVLSQMNMAYLMCLVTLGNGVRIWYSSDQEDKVLRGEMDPTGLASYV